MTLSDADIAALKDKGYKAALLWHTSSDFTNAVTAGAKDEFARAGDRDCRDHRRRLRCRAPAQRHRDRARRQAERHPVAAARSGDLGRGLPPGREDGVKLVFLSNLPNGYKHGTDYAAIVTDDLFQMGKQAADALAKAIGGKGKVGYIFHDASYYVTNQRDQAFKTTIEKDYPGIKIVAEQGISDPARAEELAQRHAGARIRTSTAST